MLNPTNLSLLFGITSTRTSAKSGSKCLRRPNSSFLHVVFVDRKWFYTCSLVSRRDSEKNAQSASRHAPFQKRNLKNFLWRGTAHPQTPPHWGEGSPDLTPSVPSAPRLSRLRRSTAVIPTFTINRRPCSWPRKPDCDNWKNIYWLTSSNPLNILNTSIISPRRLHVSKVVSLSNRNLS